jgi:hypothetical protein
MHHLGDVKGSKKKRSEWNIVLWEVWVPRYAIRKRPRYFNGFGNREATGLVSLRGGLYSHRVEKVVQD